MDFNEFLNYKWIILKHPEENKSRHYIVPL